MHLSFLPSFLALARRSRFTSGLMFFAISVMVLCEAAFGQSRDPFSLVDGRSSAAFSLLMLGFGLGIKHALDADHLLAVSTIVGERRGFLSSSVVGILWGTGHTAALLLVGIAVIALHIQIPEKMALATEFSVAIMLVGLGIRTVWKLLRGWTLHVHVHSHEDQDNIHAHLHVHEKGHADEHAHSHHPMTFDLLRPVWWQSQLQKGKRSILIGMLHGLAGSASLMLIVLATIPTTSLALSYIGMFGLGSIGGMVVMSTLIGIPFAMTARRSVRMNLLLRGFSGVFSIGFGLFLAWQVGFVEGLFL